MNSLLVLQYKIYQLYSKIKKDVINKVDIKDFFNREEDDRLFYSFYLTTPLIKGSHYIIDYYTCKDSNTKDVELQLYEHYKYNDYPFSIIPFIINSLLGKDVNFQHLGTGFYCFFKGALPKKLNSQAECIFSTSCQMNIPRYNSEYNLVIPDLIRTANYNGKDFINSHLNIRDDKYFQSRFGSYTSLFKSCYGAYDIYAAIIDSIILMMDFYKPWDIHFEPLGS